MSAEAAAEIRTTHILDLAAEGKRLDGREPDEYRTVTVEPGFVVTADGSALARIGSTAVLAGIKLEPGKPFADTPNAGVLTTNAELVPLTNPTVEPGFVVTADGSALARIGDTAVLAGIKLEPGKPFPDTPNAGVLTTNAELVPLSNPTFEPGPPTPIAIEVSRVVDRAIRAAETIDLTRLCVTPNEKSWVCYTDVHVLDHDGNLIDAALLAAESALAHATDPAKRF